MPRKAAAKAKLAPAPATATAQEVIANLLADFLTSELTLPIVIAIVVILALVFSSHLAFYFKRLTVELHILRMQSSRLHESQRHAHAR